MRLKVVLIKCLGVALVGGAVLFAILAALTATRYSLYLAVYLEQATIVAILGGMLAFITITAIGGVILLRSRAIKSKAIPFIMAFAFVTIAGPVTGMAIVETRVIKGEIDLGRISALYSTRVGWESRASTIRQGILKGAELLPVPSRIPLNALNHSKRAYTNYSVENVYFESLPGFFLAGNLYRHSSPGAPGPRPAILVAHGHHNDGGHFDEEIQHVAADLARLGANVFTWDMVGYGESTLPLHETSHALTIQLWNSMRALDFVLGLNDTDPARVGMTGASGGGTQTILLAAIDRRLNISAPVAMVSSFMFGGCICESGMPIHEGEGYATNNAEIASLHAPRPLLLVSDGGDWTRFTPTLEFPFIQRIYGLYDAMEEVQNVHLEGEGHDFGPVKRDEVVRFFASHFNLVLSSVGEAGGRIDEASNTVEAVDAMRAFTPSHPMPPGALGDEASVLAAMRALQPGWRSNEPATVGDPFSSNLAATTCIIATIAAIASRRESFGKRK